MPLDSVDKTDVRYHLSTGRRMADPSGIRERMMIRL